MRVSLRASAVVGGRGASLEAPIAYARANLRISIAGSEVWLALEGKSLTIDLRRLGGRALLRPREALEVARDVLEAAKELAGSGYSVDLRVRGLKLMTLGRRRTAGSPGPPS